MPRPELADIEHLIGYDFKKKAFGLEAATHSSLLNEPPGAGRDANPRLAHLDDAVVDLAVRDALFHKFPRATKGELTAMKQDLVSDEGLASLVIAKQVAALIERGGSRPPEEDNATVIAEAFDPLIGAIYLDSDFNTGRLVGESSHCTASELETEGVNGVSRGSLRGVLLADARHALRGEQTLNEGRQTGGDAQRQS